MFYPVKVKKLMIDRRCGMLFPDKYISYHISPFTYLYTRFILLLTVFMLIWTNLFMRVTFHCFHISSSFLVFFFYGNKYFIHFFPCEQIVTIYTQNIVNKGFYVMCFSVLYYVCCISHDFDDKQNKHLKKERQKIITLNL